MLTGGIYPGMITATIGTALLIAVVVSSVVVVRRHVRYEAWYAIHLTVYASIALAWFHQIPTGNELVLDRARRRLLARPVSRDAGAARRLPRARAASRTRFRFRMRVTEVVDEGAGVVSLRIEGRRLDRLRAQAGQFFLWRFLSRDRWWASHPFSLSAAPDGRSLRITIKDLGDFTSRAATIAPGTRVVAEGPFGVFTDAVRRRPKVALIGGGIGITPIRSLLEEMDGDLVVVYRVLERGRRHLRRRAQRARGEQGSRVARRRRRPPLAGRPRAPLARTPAGARPRHRRARGLRLRAARDGGRRPQERPRGQCPVPLHPHGALRALNRTGAVDATSNHGNPWSGGDRTAHGGRCRRHREKRHRSSHAEEDRRHQDGLRPGGRGRSLGRGDGHRQGAQDDGRRQRSQEG